MNRQFLVFPQPLLNIDKSKTILSEAVRTADEIWWASAYLTSWPLDKDSVPRPNCTSNIVVGSDFGITRKAALTDLLSWNRKAKSNIYINEMSGFHPKTILWKSGDKHYALIGSSNLSIAAWSSNVELNVIIDITKDEYSELTKWFEEFVIFASPSLTAKWVKEYKESNRKGKSKTDAMEQIYKRIEKFGNVNLNIPKKQQNCYYEIKDRFVKLVKSCAEKKVSNEEFYDHMRSLLENSWYGSPVWQITCKNAAWDQSCRELMKIFDSLESERDKVVKEVIDSLQKSKNPTRGA